MTIFFEKQTIFRNIFKMICFLTNDNIDRKWIKREFNKQIIQNVFIIFVDRQYITFNNKFNESRYVTHNFIQSMFQT